jgi:hypothetical protein
MANRQWCAIKVPGYGFNVFGSQYQRSEFFLFRTCPPRNLRSSNHD